MFKKTAPIAAALIGLAFTATPSFAKDVLVHYGDLDLSTAEGQKTLDTRLRKAAREACDYNQRTTGSLLPTAEARACYVTAQKNVASQVAAAVNAADNGERLGG